MTDRKGDDGGEVEVVYILVTIRWMQFAPLITCDQTQ